MTAPRPRSGDRFVDDGRTLGDFTHEVLVTCPRCAQAAVVLAMPYGDDQFAETPHWIEPRRLVCPGCGLSRDKSARGGTFGAPADPYFQLPLWLQTPAAGHIVWAYNADHLAHLRNFVAATRRERVVVTGQPRSLVDKLPQWFVIAKHRGAITAALDRLQQRLESGA